MEEAKNANQDGCPNSYPQTRDEEWLGNELLLLADAEEANLPCRQFKCTKCRCINTYLATNERAEQILSSGRKMMHRHECRFRGCYCHTGLGVEVQIITRILDWGDVPFA